jgi:hypothetical protein
LSNYIYAEQAPRMRLSREEEAFLYRWVYDEAHYQEGVGPAKGLQVQHALKPADLAILIAAALPEPAEQEAMALKIPAKDRPAWPWLEDEFTRRLEEARATLAERHTYTPSTTSSGLVPEP